MTQGSTRKMSLNIQITGQGLTEQERKLQQAYDYLIDQDEIKKKRLEKERDELKKQKLVKQKGRGLTNTFGTAPVAIEKEKPVSKKKEKSQRKVRGRVDKMSKLPLTGNGKRSRAGLLHGKGDTDSESDIDAGAGASVQPGGSKSVPTASAPAATSRGSAAPMIMIPIRVNAREASL